MNLQTVATSLSKRTQAVQIQLLLRQSRTNLYVVDSIHDVYS